jgi:sulfotransferase
MDKKKIFVSGLPRANSTLICNILANNPRIRGGETSPLLEYIYSAVNSYTSSPESKAVLTKEEMQESLLSFCKSGLNGYANYMCGENHDIYLDKSRGWLHYAPLLWELEPNAKIIVMVRDIRAILSSFEKKWRDNPTVIDSRDVPIKQEFITIESRVNHWLNEPPLGIALKRLYNSIHTGNIKKMLVVKAESLSKNPEETMRAVYNFIEEPYFEMDYSNVKQVTVENDRIADFGIYGDHKIRHNVLPLKNDFENYITSQISESIKISNKWFYDTFNYSI